MSHQSDLPPHVPSCVLTGAGVAVPNATATPRTDAIKFTAQLWDPEVGEETVVVVFASDYATIERELTAAKAQLRERTQWQCACGGTDCAGQAENERLRAEVERLKGKRAPVQGFSAGIPWEMHLRAYDVYCKRHGEQRALVDLEGRNCRGGFHASELDEFIPGWREELTDRDQLRARVADLESQLAASATKAAAEYGEQLKPLFAKVRELEADKARLQVQVAELKRESAAFLAALGYNTKGTP